MTDRMSPDTLSNLIGLVYDCVLEPRKWETVLRTISAEFGFLTAVLSVTPMQNGVARHDVTAIHSSVGLDISELTDAVTNLGEDLVDLWGGRERILAFPLDEPIICSEITPPEEWPGNRYFQAIAAPRDIGDGIAVFVARDPTLVGSLGFGLPRTLGAIQPDRVAELRLITPHIRRAVTISGLFELKAVEASAFSATLDTLVAGAVLVNETGAILHANSVAAEMLAAGDPIRSQRGRLGLSQPGAQAALDRAMRQASFDEVALGQRGIAVPAVARNGGRHVLHVLPLRQGDMRRRVLRNATAAVFIASAALPPPLPSGALTLLYDLTPAEARVFEMICAGRTQTETAAALGVAASTVKTHLLHVFEKTGCRRQVDLVKLASGLSLPV